MDEAVTPRWLWWVPVGILLIMAGLLGYRQGWLAANMTETAAIEAYAARYMRDTGATLADCTAVPGTEVWLVIRCGTGKDRRVYRVNRLGRLIGPPDAQTRDLIREPSI